MPDHSPALARLRLLLREATPGPWRVSEIETGVADERIGIVSGDDIHGVVTHGGLWPSLQASTDAALIVAAVNALGPLLDVAEAADDYAESCSSAQLWRLRKALVALKP